MNGKSTSRSRVVAVVAVLVALAVAALLISHNWQQTEQIRTAAASYQDMNDTVSTNGKVEPIVEFQAHASAPGIVENLYVDLNQKVRVGELLLRMDDQDASARLAAGQASLTSAQALQHDLQHGGTQDELNGFQANLQSAMLQLQQSQQQLTQLQNLQKTGAASASEVAGAQQRVDTAQANVDAIHTRMSNRFTSADMARSKAQVADAQASIRAASGVLSNMDIRSPIAGTVYSRSVSRYDYVPTGEELLKIADLTRMRVRAYFDEPDIGKLAAGQPVIITWEAKRGKTWHGHVLTPPTTVSNYTTRNVGAAIITIDDADGDLPPYANVTATVTTAQLHHVLAIPHEALRTQGINNYVFTVQNGQLVRTPIQVGISNFTRVQVTGGLKDGEKVATGAVTNRELTEGMRVTMVDEPHD